jgi:hypothetical protein
MKDKKALLKFLSTQGYKKNSPDVNRPFNVIPGNRITMKGVDFPVLGIDNLGNRKFMHPGQDYKFPGDYVTEIPQKQIGGNVFANFFKNKKKNKEKNDDFDMGNHDAYLLDEVTITPGDRYSNKFRDNFDYTEPEHINNIRKLQQERGLPATGYLGPKTKETLQNETVVSNESNDRISYLEQEMERVKAVRNEYQQRVKQESQKLGDTFGMNSDVYSKLNNDPAINSKVNQCIGGVCTFLNEKVEPGIFKKPTTNGIYYSNNSFENNAREEGWQQHMNYNLTKPDIGDIIMRFDNTFRTRHAVLVSDYDDKTGKYTLVDNDGGKSKRVRQLDADEVAKKYNFGKSTSEGTPMGYFFRRTKFGDNDIASLQREHGQLKKPVIPEEYRHNEKYDHKGFQIDQTASGKKNFNMFTEGVNDSLQIANDLYKDIPEEHLEALALIVGGISGNESRFGKDSQLTYEKGYKYNVSKYVRNLKGTKDGSSPLSVGISQMNPAMLNENVLRKYFPNEKNSDKIAKRIASDPKLQGQITMEEMAHRYRNFRENPNLYDNDPEKFWYALTRGWKNPGFALTDKGKDFINNWDVDYSNAAMENIDKYFDLKKKKRGGEIGCAECGGQFQVGGQKSQDPMWSPGMMFQPGNPIEAMLVGAQNWMDPSAYKPEPLDMSGFDDSFDNNQAIVDKNRESELHKNRFIGVNEKPPEFIGDSGLSGMGKQEEAGHKMTGQEMAFAGLGIMGGLDRFLASANNEDMYNKRMRSIGNSDNRFQSSTPMGSQGDYTLNVGMGNNFRPNKANYGRYQEGGEYEMSKEELDAFIAAGGEVDIL